jgi:Glycosyl hydrolases family 15
MATVRYPLSDHLRSGITANDAVVLLRQNDCLSFLQLRSGLFPAANFDNPEADETGYTNAWLRDSSVVSLDLLRVGRDYADISRAAQGIVERLNVVRHTFEKTIANGHAPLENKDRPPVRFTGQDSEPRYDWANAQNDALGYSLQFIGAAAQAGILGKSEKVKLIVDTVVAYLEAVEYWHDEENGHWEEIKKVNASSIGTVISGLRFVQTIVSDQKKTSRLIDEGQKALKEILPAESKTPGMERTADLALIFLVEPQKLVTGDMADKLITECINSLMGERGFRRYIGDGYWGPDFREHFLVGDRTADYSTNEMMAQRTKYMYPGGEAQWTFADPMVATYYARKYQKNRNERDANRAQEFLVRSLRNVIVHTKSGTSENVWRLPELFFIENGQWVPNDHLGLLWGQANLLYGLKVYQQVFADKPIKFTGAGI